MKRSSRRSIIKIIGLLLAGAALNVAVAWGCVLLMPSSVTRLARDSARLLHRRHSLIDEQAYKAILYSGYDRSGLGWSYTMVTALASAEDRSDPTPRVCRLIKAGWPMFSVAAIDLTNDHPPFSNRVITIPARLTRHPGEERYFAYLPTWPGFAVNTLFYAGVLWVMFAGPFALRRMIRRRRGQCPACAYPVGSSAVCTECGAALKPM